MLSLCMTHLHLICMPIVGVSLRGGADAPLENLKEVIITKISSYIHLLYNISLCIHKARTPTI